MMHANSQSVSDRLPQITREISKVLTNSLTNRSTLPNEVQGFTEYHFLSFSNRTPIQVENLFGPKFTRNFDPSLQSAIQDIVSNNQLDKTQLDAILIEKYLGIDLSNLDDTLLIQSNLQPNAYHSLPNQEDDDYFLHLYFLQPFRLFGITEENRKYISNSETRNREWIWHPSHPEGDVAPIFRKIIQVYILNTILQNYTSSADQVKSPIIAEHIDLFMGLHRCLLKEISREFSQVFDKISERPKIENNPQGVIHNNQTITRLDNQFPGFLDVMSNYPIGRLLFGQPLVEPRHEVASRELSQNTISAKARYAFFWLFAHLNVATSIFWARTAVEICKLKWRNFKNYVTNPQIPFFILLLQSVLFIPNAFILISSPLLVVLPWIYGVSSIPFTLLRSLFMHGPFDALRKFKYLKIIDGLELSKDAFLFIWFALPVMDVFVGVLTGILPAAILTLGAVTSGVLIFAGLIALAIWADANIDLDVVEALSSTRYFQLVGSVLFFGVGAYISLAVLCRNIAPIIPPAITNRVSHLFSSLNNFANYLNNSLQPFFGKKVSVELSQINPNVQVEPILLAKISAQFEISEEIQEELDELRKKLLMLNSSLHISPERKKDIRAQLSALEVNPESSEESIQVQIAAARKIIKNNFTPEEATGMSKLLSCLKAKNPEFATRLEMSSIESVGHRGGYQPSSAILKELVHQGHLNKSDKTWNLPPEVNEFTRKTAKKCIRLD